MSNQTKNYIVPDETFAEEVLKNVDPKVIFPNVPIKERVETYLFEIEVVHVDADVDVDTTYLPVQAIFTFVKEDGKTYNVTIPVLINAKDLADRVKPHFMISDYDDVDYDAVAEDADSWFEEINEEVNRFVEYNTPDEEVVVDSYIKVNNQSVQFVVYLGEKGNETYQKDSNKPDLSFLPKNFNEQTWFVFENWYKTILNNKSVRQRFINTSERFLYAVNELVKRPEYKGRLVYGVFENIPYMYVYNASDWKNNRVIRIITPVGIALCNAQGTGKELVGPNNALAEFKKALELTHNKRMYVSSNLTEPYVNVVEMMDLRKKVK